MAKSTAYKILVLLDEMDDNCGYDHSYIAATDSVREHIRENYPDDFRQYENDQQKETAS